MFSQQLWVLVIHIHHTQSCNRCFPPSPSTKKSTYQTQSMQLMLCFLPPSTKILYQTCTCVLDTCCHATMCGISANSGSTIHTYDTCTCVLDTCCHATMCRISANSGSAIHTHGTCTCVLDTCCYATMCGISANSGSAIHTHDTCTCVLDTCCYATMCGISANSGSTIHTYVTVPGKRVLVAHLFKIELLLP